MIAKSIFSTKRRFDPPAALLAAVWLAILAGGYVLYARQAAISLQYALHERDAAKVSRHIEWSSLGESLKEMFGALMLEAAPKAEAKDEFEKAGAALATTLGPAIVNGMIDTYVNPKGLEKLFSDETSVEGPASQVKNFNAARVMSYRVVSPTRYEIEIGEADGKKSEFAIVMELRGLSWLVTGIIPKKPMAEIASAAGM